MILLYSPSLGAGFSSILNRFHFMHKIIILKILEHDPKFNFIIAMDLYYQ